MSDADFDATVFSAPPPPPSSPDVALPPAATADTAFDEEPPSADTLFESSLAWVEGWMMRYTSRPAAWCDQWADHPDVGSRIYDLWKAWEVAFVEGGAAMSSWWLLHFDGHMAYLGAPRGPFARCHAGHVSHDPWSQR